MFRYGVYSDLLHPNYLFPGNYVVQGDYLTAIGAANTTENYLFNTHADAETALAASDFVVISVNGANTGVIGIDMRGDAGGATQLATDGSATPGQAPFFFARGERLILPASLFPASQSTRTGTLIGSATGTIYFEFCSYPTAPSSSEYYPANYTVNGHYFDAAVSNTVSDYLFNATAEGYLSSSDFVMVHVESSSATIPIVFFDTRGDGGGTSLSLTDGNRTGGQIIHSASAVSPIVLPASIFTTGNTTRTGCIQSQTSTGSRGITFTFCSYI